jgi:hypothetical protein
MVHKSSNECCVIFGSMKCVFMLLVAFTFLHLVTCSQATLDPERFQVTEKEAILTPALRYRRYRILQVEDQSNFNDEIFGPLGGSALTQGKPEKKNRFLNIDETVWGRLLQSDGSLSMSMPTAPTPSQPPVVETAAPATPSQPPVVITAAPATPSQPPVVVTAAPTTCSSMNRSDTVLRLLEDITPDLANATSSSPQGMALSWILSDDDTDPCVDPDSVQRRYALAALFLSTSGKSWINSTGWLSMEFECSWYGISCSDTGDVERFELGKFNSPK